MTDSIDHGNLGYILHSGNAAELRTTGDSLLENDPTDWKGHLCRAYADIGEGMLSTGFEELADAVESMPTEYYRSIREEIVRKCAEGTIRLRNYDDLGEPYRLDINCWNKDEDDVVMFTIAVQEEVLNIFDSLEQRYFINAMEQMSAFTENIIKTYDSPGYWAESMKCTVAMKEKIRESEEFRSSSRSLQRWQLFMFDVFAALYDILLPKLERVIDTVTVEEDEALMDYWSEPDCPQFREHIEGFLEMQIKLSENRLIRSIKKRRLERMADRFIETALIRPLEVIRNDLNRTELTPE